MVAYEFALLTMGLKDFVFYGPRNDFISANREGVVSSFGYLSICLIGIEFGRTIFKALYYEQKDSDIQKQTTRDTALLNKLLLYDINLS